ncbi:MAG: hypothetical protein GXO36_00715, partial [Chloroflexi bacterium]|nr:hypothetical protein [Chloroflexota bacterium]
MADDFPWDDNMDAFDSGEPQGDDLVAPEEEAGFVDETAVDEGEFFATEEDQPPPEEEEEAGGTNRTFLLIATALGLLLLLSLCGFGVYWWNAQNTRAQQATLAMQILLTNTAVAGT